MGPMPVQSILSYRKNNRYNDMDEKRHFSEIRIRPNKHRPLKSMRKLDPLEREDLNVYLRAPDHQTERNSTLQSRSSIRLPTISGTARSLKQSTGEYSFQPILASQQSRYIRQQPFSAVQNKLQIPSHNILPIRKSSKDSTKSVHRDRVKKKVKKVHKRCISQLYENNKSLASIASQELKPVLTPKSYQKVI